MSRKPKRINDLELWLLNQTGRVRIEGPAAHDFATVFEARLRASGANTAFYFVPWTPRPTVFCGITRGLGRAAFFLASALRNGQVDIVLHATEATEAIITYGNPGGQRECVVDMRYTPLDWLPSLGPGQPTPTQFQQLVEAIASGAHRHARR
jgi:hypothetical protein